MLSWFKKILKKEKRADVKTAEEKVSAERGLNEEMVSSTVDLEPKESNGLAKIFEETGKEEKTEESENGAEEAEESEENKQE